MAWRIVQWLALAALALWSLFVGVADLSAAELFGGGGESLRILLTSRVPRLASILVAGGSLAISGLIMQRITQNRFVSPTTAGTMEWCRLGVMAAIIFFPDAPALLRVGSSGAS